MRGVVDPELRVVENIERFGAELQSSLAKDFEILQQGNIEIRPPGIVHRISSAISKSQAAWRGEGCRIGEQGSETLRIVSRSLLPIVRIADTVGVRARPKVISHAAVV